MTVKELIEKLQEFNPECPVLLEISRDYGEYAKPRFVELTGNIEEVLLLDQGTRWESVVIYG